MHHGIIPAIAHPHMSYRSGIDASALSPQLNPDSRWAALHQEFGQTSHLRWLRGAEFQEGVHRDMVHSIANKRAETELTLFTCVQKVTPPRKILTRMLEFPHASCLPVCHHPASPCTCCGRPFCINTRQSSRVAPALKRSPATPC